MKTLHTIYSTFAKHNMAKFLTVLTILFTVGVGNMLGAEEIVYTLTPAKGSNSSYTGNCDIDISDITWNLAGNSQMIPWRIGGKSLTKVDRALYSKDAMSNDISKIVITHGTASSITVNSMTVIVSTKSNGEGTVLSTLTPNFTASGDVTVTRPSGVSWKDAYYKIVYNVTVSGSSNKFIEFVDAEFYEETAPAVTHTVTWVVNGETYTTGSPTTSVSEGSQVTKLPTNPTLDCSGKTFVGWSNEEVTSGSKPSVLFTDAASSPDITEKTTFYAVFATSEEGGTDYLQITSENDLVAGGKYLIVGNSGSTYKALPVGKAESLTSVTPSSSKICNPATELVWTLEGSTDKWKIKSTSNDKYLQISSGNLTFATSTTLTFSVSVSSSKFTFTSSASSGNKILSYYHNGNKFNAYTTANTVYLYKQVTTYSDYTTSCTTETTITLNPNGGTISDINWKLENGVYKLTTEDASITLPAITRTGYTFGGWAISSGGSNVYDENDIITLDGSPVTLYAIWTANTYNITYKDQGDVAFSGTHENNYPTQHTYGTETTLKGATKTGYTFDGWYTDDACTKKVTTLGATDYTGNITLYAKWTANTYNITYKDQGNVAFSGTHDTGYPTQHTYGTETTLKGATKTGYTFDGWYKEAACTNIVTTLGATDYTGNITLYAKWTANKYDIIYKDQGEVAFSGTHDTGYPTQHTYGTETTLKGATKTGYTFDGWYKEAACTNIVTTLGATEYTGNITLYGKWTAKALTNYRTFCDVVCDAYSFHTGSDDDRAEWLKEAIKCFTKEGGYEHEWQIKDYIIPNDDDKFFVGNYGYFYNDNLGIGGANGKSRSVVSGWGNMYLAPAMDENDAQGTPRLGHAKGAKGTLRIFEDSNWDNLFVGFIPDGYKLKFGNEEYTFAKTTGTEYRSDVVQYNSTNADKNVSVGIVDADGKYVATNHTQEMRHIFLNTGGASFWEADNVDNFALYDITNETFTCLMHKTGYPNIYEGWVPTSCEKIIFVRLKSSTIDWNNKHNQTVDITLDATKNLYTINNWTQESDKSGGTWSVYERYGQFAMHDNSKSKNWYVHFVPHYELTYDKNAADATGTMDIQTVAVDAADKKVVVANCGFTRPGYEFVSWRKGETSTYFVAGVNHELVADVTFYAKWEAKKITITWDPNGGSVDPTKSTYTYNGTPVELPTPTRANYIFNGWFTATSGGTQIADVGTTNKPTDDVTYYAQWTAKATPTFAWSADSYTAALEADNTFPTLNNPNSLSVTYKSLDENVAKIDANGNIVLGSEGRTTITAIGAESATHKSATDTYELIVVAANCKWIETDIADINSGDEVVITMTKYGSNGLPYTYTLPNKKNTSTAPEANDITAKIQGKYLTTVDNEYKWVIEKNNAALTFYSYSDNANYLYCTNADNGVRVGTGAAKVFVVDGNYLKNTQTTDPRYVGISFNTNPYTWRCYTGTTGVIADETLKFYKKVCLDSEHYWVTWDANGGQLSDGSTKKLESYQVGADITKPADPTREGYRFDGWTPAPGTMPAENKTFTAQWTEVHTINWMVGSSNVLSEDVANGTGVTQTPSDPADGAIGSCANKFMGWSETPLGSAEGQSAPSDLCSAAQMKSKHTSVTGDKTFFAVFATKEGSSKTTQMYKLVTNISGGKEYIFATGNSAGSVNGLTCDANSNLTATSLTVKVSDGLSYIETPASNNVVWNITSSSSSYNAQNKGQSGKYLRCYGTSPNAVIATSAYALYWSDSKGLYGKSNSGSTSYYLYYNTSTSKWGAASNASGRVYAFEKSEVTVDNTSYSNYVTNCCALAPATNLTVSGTTANSATLTWTAPSPATGITKLQVRNAADDAVVVDNIAVGTTTATITGLTECTSYKYYVVSVGDCEVVSNIVTAQPYGGAKTVNYDYNGGSGSVTSFTTSCTNQTITLPAATRTSYDFNGWYTALTGGTRVGGAGETYEPATSPVTLYAQWTKQIYSITFHANGGTGTMEDQKADENNKIAQLNANQFIRTGYAFVGWNTKANGTGTAYADQATDITLTGNLTLYAQWAAIVTLNDAGTETTTHPATAGGTITLPNGANACDPYEFVGWTSVATGDWNEGINEPALVATTYTPNAPTTLYAVYKIQSEGNANAFKLSFEGGNGKTYYVGEYGSSPYLRGYSNITEADAVTFIRKKMFPNDDTKYYLYLEHLEEYLYCSSGNLYTTSNEPSESQGWVFHTVGDKIQIQAINQERYLSYSDRDDDRINITTHSTGSQESFNMLSAVTSTYVASPLCNQEIEIIFETGNGDFVDNAPATNPLTVSRGDVITLPTCEYPGYEFMGWLKDEQQLDPSDIPLTYYTGDYTVNGTSSTITFYAYYKAIPEEVEFTGKDDAELLMYYYDGTANYYYAVSHAAERGELSSKQNCFNATTWTFTNVGNMQYHIQDETGKYLGAVNDNDNDLSLSNTPKVWNFTLVNGLWKMVCEDSPSRALMNRSGNSFVNAALTNISNSAYSYVALGVCPSPTYTTNPVLTQGFTITNTVKVTSASGQKVKAASALTLETRNIELPCTFTIAAPSITFYDNAGAEITQLTASAASEQFELHFAYKPTAENTIEYPTVTITDDEHKTYTIKNRIYARSLPATFAIVAKVGNLWYALPSQGLNSTTPPAAYPIEVDDIADPKAVTAVPANADWSLRGVYEASRSDATKDRYVANGDNLVFVNNASPAMTLNASSSEEENYLLTDAQYANYYQTNPGLYEWTPTTTDLETYQLTNEQRSRTLSVNTATVFGVHAQDKAVEQVRFLPIQNRYTPAALQVVEWKEKSVVIMYNGDPAQTASASVNGAAAQNTTLSAAERDSAVYELAANGLAANPTQRLSITIGTEKVILSIPYIISGAQTDLALLPGSTVAARQEAAKVSDLVILKDATLTADGAKSNPYKFRNVTIYGGGKLVIPSEKGFGVSSLTMRVGAVESGNYKALYPQLVLNGTINSGNINIDYLTTYDRYYALSLPYSANTLDILYPAEIYGDNLKTGNKASFALQWYDGEARASETRKGWKDLQEPATLERYKGYTFWGAPRKVSVNGVSKRQNFGIHRIPIKPTANDLITGETTGKQIKVYAYPATNAYDAGWNFIGNPYLAQYGNMEDGQTSGLLGMLTQNPETGVWEHTDNYRYITLTDDGKTYWQTPVSEAELYPFNTFFVQAGENGAVSFNARNSASLPARRYAAQQETAKEITTGILLTGNDQTDRTGLLIADNFTEEYDFNADLSKFENSGINLYTIGKTGYLAYMAINQALAEQPIPVGYSAPAEGLYTIAFDEDRYNATDISALYLIDYDSNEKTNLLHTDYSFVTAAGTNNQRFALQVAFAPENATNVEWVGDATIQVGVEGNELILHNLPTDAAVHVYDALGRLMYHTPHAPTEMQLTLPTGYYLVRIADKKHAAVINTVIP